MATLSVIIPVYNSVSTLQRCVNSVLSSKTDDMEIILVDDGSNDGSHEMCDQLAQKHPSIRVIHRENGGLSAARNTGIEASSGEWLSFIDSDDEYIPDTLSSNLRWLESHPGIDMLEFPVNVHYGSSQSYILSFEPKTVSNRMVFRHWIETQGYTHCYAWNKIYRRSLFDTIRFPEGESFEDAAICPDIIQRCQAIRYSDKGCYLYYETQGSITNQYRFNVQEPLFRHNFNLLKTIVSQNFGEHSRTRLWNVCLNLLIDLKRCQAADYGYIRSNASELNSLKPGVKAIMRSRVNPKQKFKALFAWFIGVGAVCSIMGIKKYS